MDVGLKEAYFFAKNSWGMVTHPQLTTARIFKNKDYPQFFLVFGFPFNLWLVGVVGLGLVWLVGRPSGLLGQLLVRLFIVFTFFLATLSLYYASWIWRYERRMRSLRKGKR
ncbi:hypothetical protein MUP65_02560 [Patescibacteria group bacterium]|nr:hypothetical protein [Patescibacteria group bacterium]